MKTLNCNRHCNRCLYHATVTYMGFPPMFYCSFFSERLEGHNEGCFAFTSPTI